MFRARGFHRGGGAGWGYGRGRGHGGYGHGGGRDFYLALLMGQLFQQIARIERKPPVTLALIGCEVQTQK